MQIPYSFMQQSANNQIKDMAFFQILKRKGPYIERSLTKIQNDLFYRHKLSGSHMKNMAFIKQIRLTLSAYQVIVNEIRNDFMMTELDSMGDGIHKMFSQMISIVNFFVAVVLKKQKLAVDELREISNDQKKKKQLALKKAQQQMRVRQSQQTQQQKAVQFREIQHLKYNFEQLFKLQMDSDKQRQAVQKVWASIVTETINKAKQSTLVKDSQLQKIIKDSCEYMYKNYTQLDRIVRLTNQGILICNIDIKQSQKVFETFGDQSQLLQENEQKIKQMKQMAVKLANFVRERVYNRTQVMVQTQLTQGDSNMRVMTTTKQLDDKRRVQIKMREMERKLREKNEQVSEMELRLKQMELRLKHAQQSISSSQSQQQCHQHQGSKRSRQLVKKRTFINNNNNSRVNKNSSKSNGKNHSQVVVKKVSTNIGLKSNSNNKSRENLLLNQQQKVQQQKYGLYKINPKTSIKGNINNNDVINGSNGIRQGSFVIINRSEKKNKRADTVAILNSFNNFNNNNNNTTSKNKNQGKKISQLSYGVSNKMRKSSQHKFSQHQEQQETVNFLGKDNQQQSSLSVNDRKQYLNLQQKYLLKKQLLIDGIVGDGHQEKQTIVHSQQQLNNQQQQTIQLLPQYIVNKKFYKIRNSHLVLQARSFEEVSRTLQQEMMNNDNNIGNDNNSSQSEEDQLKMQDNNNQRDSVNGKVNNRNNLTTIVSADSHNINIKKRKQNLPTYNQTNTEQSNVIKQQSLHKNMKLALNHNTVKLTIRPSIIKRYIQSTYNHPLTQQKPSHLLLDQSVKLTNNNNRFSSNNCQQQSRFYKNKLQKVSKSNSHSDYYTKSDKGYFESLQMKDNPLQKLANQRQQKMRCLLKNKLYDKKKQNYNYHSLSSLLNTTNNNNNDKQNIHQQQQQQQLTIMQSSPKHISSQLNNTISFNTNSNSKLKSQTKHNKSQSNQKSQQYLESNNSFVIKSPIYRKEQNKHKQNTNNNNIKQGNLKKSSVVGRNVSYLCVSMGKQRSKGLKTTGSCQNQNIFVG